MSYSGYFRQLALNIDLLWLLVLRVQDLDDDRAVVTTGLGNTLAASVFKWESERLQWRSMFAKRG